jgi:hypothetical protein
MRVGICGVSCVLALGLGFTGVLAQSAAHHHEFHEDYYQTWQRPDVGGSCCNARTRTDGREVGDCEPTAAEVRDGKWFAWLRQQKRWVEVPDNVIIHEINPSPEQAHLCWGFERVLCFLPPYTDG